jgi:hypothetical protein
VGKAESKPLYFSPVRDSTLASSSLAWKFIKVEATANTVAYYDSAKINAIKSFKPLYDKAF